MRKINPRLSKPFFGNTSNAGTGLGEVVTTPSDFQNE